MIPLCPRCGVPLRLMVDFESTVQDYCEATASLDFVDGRWEQEMVSPFSCSEGETVESDHITRCASCNQRLTEDELVELELKQTVDWIDFG